jgi:hypothetical protein
METKEFSFAPGLLETCSLAKQIVMTQKLLRSFSLFVSVAVKYFSKSDGIDEL